MTNHKWPQFAWIIACAAGIAGYAIKYPPAASIATNPDTIHQFATVSWFYHALAENAGPLNSPAYLYPTPGLLGSSEIPFLQGVVFLGLRLLGFGPFLAWNLVFALCTSGNLLSAYFAFRHETRSPLSAMIGALVFASYPLWLFELDSGIWFRTAFGLPLSWYLLSQIKKSPVYHRLYFLLGLCLICQFLASATNTLSAILLVSLRTVSEPKLRKKLIPTGLSVIPVVMAGLFQNLHFNRMTPPEDVLGKDYFLSRQIMHRLDLANFIPFPSQLYSSLSERYFHLDYRTLKTLFLAPVSFAILALLAWRSMSIASGQRSWVTAFGYFIPAFLLSVLGIILSNDLIDLGVLTNTSGILILALFLGCLSMEVCRSADIGIRPLFILLLYPALLSLGPVIFLFGKPVMTGPFAGLEVIAPMLLKVRVPARLLLVCSIPIALLSAYAIDRILGKVSIAATPLAILVCIFLFLNPGLQIWAWPIPTVQAFDLRPSEHTCTGCHYPGSYRIPEPYSWIKRSGLPGGLLELPAGLKDEATRDGTVRFHDSYYQFYFALDGIARLNGFTSIVPKSYVAFIQQLHEFPSNDSLDMIRLRKGSWILIHGDRYLPQDWELLQKRLNPPPEGLVLEKKWGPVWLFRLAPEALSSPP